MQDVYPLLGRIDRCATTRKGSPISAQQMPNHVPYLDLVAWHREYVPDLVHVHHHQMLGKQAPLAGHALNLSKNVLAWGSAQRRYNDTLGHALNVQQTQSWQQPSQVFKDRHSLTVEV